MITTNAQEAFDVAVRGVLLDPSTKRYAAYRAPSTSGSRSKCAIGHLIPDDAYHPELENNFIVEFLLPDHPLLPLLSKLQVAHDTQTLFDEEPFSHELFASEARKIAAEFNLSDAAVTDALAERAVS